MIGSNLTYGGLENLEQIKIARTTLQNQMVRRGHELLKQRSAWRAGIKDRITSASLPGSSPVVTTANIPQPSTLNRARTVASNLNNKANQAAVHLMLDHPRAYGAIEGAARGMGGMTPGVGGGVVGAIGGAIEAVPTSSRAVNTLGSMFTSAARSL
jgi:hypothetical protein